MKKFIAITFILLSFTQVKADSIEGMLGLEAIVQSYHQREVPYGIRLRYFTADPSGWGFNFFAYLNSVGAVYGGAGYGFRTHGRLFFQLDWNLHYALTRGGFGHTLAASAGFNITQNLYVNVPFSFLFGFPLTPWGFEFVPHIGLYF